MKYLHKFLLFLTTLLLLLGVHKRILYEDAKSKLLGMREDECIQFVQDRGIEIPPDLDNGSLGSFIKQNIRATLEYPEHLLPYNYTVTSDLADAIHETVIAYLRGR